MTPCRRRSISSSCPRPGLLIWRNIAALPPAGVLHADRATAAIVASSDPSVIQRLEPVPATPLVGDRGRLVRDLPTGATSSWSRRRSTGPGSWPAARQPQQCVRVGHVVRRGARRCLDPLRRPVAADDRDVAARVRVGGRAVDHEEAGASMRAGGRAWLAILLAALAVVGASVAERLGAATPPAGPTGDAVSSVWLCPHGGGPGWQGSIEIANPGDTPVEARLTAFGDEDPTQRRPGGGPAARDGVARRARRPAVGRDRGAGVRRMGRRRLGRPRRREGSGPRRRAVHRRAGRALDGRRRRHDTADPFLLGGDEPVRIGRGGRRRARTCRDDRPSETRRGRTFRSEPAVPSRWTSALARSARRSSAPT